ncbi:MAG: hypothetical protein NZ455_13725 [Bacteroidia bacterium]|nr:hypothetical protein [Bacteroidia bacterium]MDW8345584.1 hypothetical protein [Bacteroidia bacterium]
MVFFLACPFAALGSERHAKKIKNKIHYRSTTNLKTTQKTF